MQTFKCKLKYLFKFYPLKTATFTNFKVKIFYFAIFHNLLFASIQTWGEGESTPHSSPADGGKDRETVIGAPCSAQAECVPGALGLVVFLD